MNLSSSKRKKRTGFHKSNYYLIADCVDNRVKKAIQFLRKNQKNYQEIADFLGIKSKFLVSILHGQRAFSSRNIRLLQNFVEVEKKAQVKKENGGLVNES